MNILIRIGLHDSAFLYYFLARVEIKNVEMMSTKYVCYDGNSFTYYVSYCSLTPWTALKLPHFGDSILFCILHRHHLTFTCVSPPV